MNIGNIIDLLIEFGKGISTALFILLLIEFGKGIAIALLILIMIALIWTL
jgi:hypothetical protein